MRGGGKEAVEDGGRGGEMVMHKEKRKGGGEAIVRKERREGGDQI